MGRLAVLCAVLLACVAAAAVAAEAPRYPPYPEVWGRELPRPEGRIVNGFAVRDAGDGDVVLIYAHRAVDPATGNLLGDGQWARLSFFSGAHGTITAAEAAELRRRYAVPKMQVRARRTEALVFAGGDKVIPTSREAKGVGCWLNYAGELRMFNADDRVVAQKVVLRRLDPPERREYWSRCEYGQSGDHYFAKVDALAMVLYPLADGTFLAEATSSPFMIRFRADLTSPFVAAHPDLFLVDADDVDRIVRAAYYAKGMHRIQVGNDALAAWLATMAKGK